MKKFAFFKFKEEKCFIYLGMICLILIFLPINNKPSNKQIYTEYISMEYILILKSILLLWIIMAFRLAFLTFKQHLFIKNTPTSKLNSAAQGYVNIEGTALELPEKILLAPISQTPCIWYNYQIKDKKSYSRYPIVILIKTIFPKLTIIEEESSNQEFALTDSKEEVIVDPDDAAITSNVTNIWYSNNLYKEGKFYNILNNTNKDIKKQDEYKYIWKFLFPKRYEYIENLLLPKQQIYISGFFRSIPSPKIIEQKKNKNQETLKLLKTWKKDYKELLEKFDTNKDGNIDTEEWERAVKEAEQQINLKYYNEPLQSSTINVISKQGLLFNQPFIISVDNKSKIAKKLNIKFFIYLILFICAIFLLLSLDYWYADSMKFIIQMK